MSERNLMNLQLIEGDCTPYLASYDAPEDVALTFLDPPFNQGKDYAHHDDDLPQADYWAWMQNICTSLYKSTLAGGAIYFMQREKNTEDVLRCLRETGWVFQNLIIWKKMTSAVPSTLRYGKQYQIIAYATKGERPRIFHRLRISPPLAPHQKVERTNGMYVTDVWDDIRELTSGYFAGDEPLRRLDGSRFHKQQAPLALLLRIILSSTLPGDLVIDPFAGTGTTLMAAAQSGRRAIGIERDPENITGIRQRLASMRKTDQIARFRNDYRFTDDLDAIWGDAKGVAREPDVFNLPLFQPSDSE